ncbi:hypothetical protein AY600_02020 [Phormidium willei BDU 130791]|nr:hypothetical protein AY600_02020 [Phormidium willei BDU 130791]
MTTASAARLRELDDLERLATPAHAALAAGGRRPARAAAASSPPAAAHPHLAAALAEGHGGFLRYLSLRLGDRDEAEDVLQEFYLRVLLKAGQIRDPAAPMPWLRRVLKSVAVDHIRRRAAARRAEHAAQTELSVLTAGQSRLDSPPAAGGDCVCPSLESALAGLRPDYCDLLRRVDLQGQSRETACQALGITPANLRVRLHRARHALKRSLEDSCRSCATRDCLRCGVADPPARAA